MKNIPLQPVESSQIEAIGHDADTNTLAVKFRRGNRATYHYSNFPPEEFEAFKAASSKGVFFEANVRGKYEYQKIVPQAQEAA